MRTNERGNILIMAMVFVAVMSGMTVTIFKAVDQSNRLSVLPRVRANMAQVEQKVRMRAQDPNAYTGCEAEGGAASCSLQTGLFTSMGTSWVAVENVRFDPANQTLHAEVTPVETSTYRLKNLVKKRILDIPVKKEVLTEEDFECDDATPFFVGFDSDGKSICRSLPNKACPRGTYVQSVNPTTLEPVCAPAGQTVACSSGQKISSINWVGGSNVTKTCIPRPAPKIEVTLAATPPPPPPPPPPIEPPVVTPPVVTPPPPVPIEPPVVTPPPPPPPPPPPGLPVLTALWKYSCGSGETDTAITDDGDDKHNLGEESSNGKTLHLCMGTADGSTPILSSWVTGSCGTGTIFSGVYDDQGDATKTDRGMNDGPNTHSLCEGNRRPDGSISQRWCIGIDSPYHKVETAWYPYQASCPAGWVYIMSSHASGGPANGRDMNSEEEKLRESLCMRISYL